jgi:hypothetical protein
MCIQIIENAYATQNHFFYKKYKNLSKNENFKRHLSAFV